MSQTKVLSEINGSMWKVLVKEGDVVSEDDTLAVVESMKMEIPVLAPMSGTVDKILVVEGQVVIEGVPLMLMSH
ncbi:MAG TPA: acetyl-CoA carboxylase biotin carboxyl carrier protein subunit [Polaromonas sp.]|jgi:acetyl-CoA carboxylase biotin carboxyl carrier protein|uniref:acetyl-CoA carboxylase biotin carboxyl carrier protein subunit n=1 Tax=unclassified Polaromonas TaxID=2638319 RepID=UPI000BC56B76|nr:MULTISPECIES: acetyl-CoA carboxylase biotin carboxyl carrier protein subunit [unclassified Polaromonas]OYY39326.1 MAG: acetyl-CoA carboxylase biotin carboxyl carrier protein subunit [Polaromonas sp. 35-63-35]OYZ20425.1 MAG: acetyl-CoA carboxylase biotin carboxyl carrier protein subunit [Polaromonas sp. 16-63-31]OYZ80631.1 MAG: acetyl-CoA carboxylase biotin carboxyl carrier protein subunit [Polaromonas sp. 24-63-21]OZA51693.1 MAG: acetyl-CoA carboxylase biotin carboxyl carrier protein subunit